MRTSLLAAIFVMVGGCGGGSTGGSPMVAALVTCGSAATSGSSNDRINVFGRLTATVWADAACGISNPLPPTCTSLELRGDGTYVLRSVSDVVERDDLGHWNFNANDGSSGVVCLDGQAATPSRTGDSPNLPSAMSFRLSDGSLEFGPFGFAPAPGGSRAPMGNASDLAPVAMPGRWPTIATGASWTKTNEFDLFMAAQEITFEPNGLFTASYRDHACTHGGHFSWDKSLLVPASDPNACDLRGPTTATIAASNEEPEFIGETLVFYRSSYRLSTSTTDMRLFAFDPYFRSLRVRGEYQGTFGANRPTDVHLIFENREARSKALQKLVVIQQKLGPAPAGFTLDGDPTTLLARDYGNLAIAASASVEDVVTLTPNAAGETMSFVFTVDYSDDRQPYHGSQSYVLTVMP